MKIDVIVPAYHIDADFEVNLKSWLRELPVNKLYIGAHDTKLLDYLDYDNRIVFIDMSNVKTLGKELVKLMSLVETEWFAFVHTDVEITSYAYKQMKPMMVEGVGMIESEHLHIEDGVPKYYNYYNEPRAYSGFQLIRKACIESSIIQIEDDYVYRNEDLIFQNVCEFNGYTYKKNYALHLHKIVLRGNTYSNRETHSMQWKGLIKYSPLVNDFMTKLILGSVKYNMKLFDLTKKEVLEFTKNENIKWLEIIKTN